MPTNPSQALTPASPSYHTNVAPMPTQPAQDRVVATVPPMPIVPLSIEHVFDAKTGKPRLDRLKEHFLREGRLDKECAKRILREASALFKAEPNLLDLRYPITVCGDIHGQYYDLIRLFDVGGDPKDTQYLFLGDYVDRGCFSCEVVFYLYAHKIFYPKTFFMLRGNHECRQLTSFFNFKDECQYKYDVEMYDLIMDSFDHLPIGAMVNRSFFCVHGGLSPEIATLSDIASLDRHQETPREGPMCDLLWSDPYDEEGGVGGDSAPMSDAEAAGSKHAVALNTSASAATWFVYNETRQCSYIYGSDAVRQFLDDNKITSIIRAHEAQVDGYKMHMVNAETGIPRVITIFSAPNYCDVYKNKAACLKFDHPNILNIKQFVETQHPYYLPNFMDVFQWSLPFVAEKVTDMLASVLDFNIEDGEPGSKAKPLESRGNLLKKKVMAVTKLVRMYKVLREQSEAIVQLKQLTPNHKIPLGVLQSGAEGIKDALTAFEKARAADRESERHPCPSPPTALLQRRFSRTFNASGDTPASSPVMMLKARLDAGPIEGLIDSGSSGFGSPTLKVESLE